MKRIYNAYKELLSVLFSESPVLVIITFASAVLYGLITPLSIWVNSRIFDLGLLTASWEMSFSAYIPYLILFVLLSLLPVLVGDILSNSYIRPKCQLIIRTASLADRIIVFEGGRIVQDGTHSVHFSKYHYQRIFREAVGDSVMGYVARRRISLAAMELARTDASVLKIALKYGYDSHEGFTRSFRSHMGITPTEYRKYHLSTGTFKMQEGKSAFACICSKMDVAFRLMKQGADGKTANVIANETGNRIDNKAEDGSVDYVKKGNEETGAVGRIRDDE